ncbi:MAG: topoisomerase DNA-binding C4 zinc finger domain-containing protein [Promethearchaeota archaeon]
MLDVVKRFEAKKYLEEERRLFYVALTRGKKLLFLFTVEGNHFLFLEEIRPYLKIIHVSDSTIWDDIISKFISKILRGEKIETSEFCPNCGKLLREVKRKFGTFLSCSGYPKCTYSFDIIKKDDIKCPECGRKLVIRRGKYGQFLGCLGYPECKFTFNLTTPFKSKTRIYCPRCGNNLILQVKNGNPFLICINISKCKFFLKI